MSMKREQNRTRQRKRILEAAHLLFGSRSFDQVTMLEVASKAKVSRATVFNYFPSKHALVEAITEDVFSYFRGMLENALKDEASPTPTLIRAMFVHMAGIENLRGFYSGVFREIVKIQVGLDEGGSAQLMRGITLNLLEQLIERGQKRGDMHTYSSATDLARAFDALTHGTIIRWLYEDSSVSLRSHMERAAQVFLGPVAVGDLANPDSPAPELAPLDEHPLSRFIDPD